MRKSDIEAIEHMKEVWEVSRRSADDPGLRERYAEVPRLPIQLICSRLDKEINHGNLLRIAEAFRLEHVHFAPTKELSRLGSMGGHVWQPWSWTAPDEAILSARREGYTVYALDIRETAVDVHRVSWTFPVALVIGEELTGIDADVAEQCDQAVAIPLYGLMQSLNVAVATGICLDQIAGSARQLDECYSPVRAISQRLL